MRLYIDDQLVIMASADELREEIPDHVVVGDVRDTTVPVWNQIHNYRLFFKPDLV
jgi:hypothetical protein